MNERAGDQVFTDVDLALADRIIARSKENNRGAAPVFANGNDAAYSGDLVCRAARQLYTPAYAGENSNVYTKNMNDTHDMSDTGQPCNRGITVIKIAAAILAALALAVILFRRRKIYG